MPENNLMTDDWSKQSACTARPDLDKQCHFYFLLSSGSHFKGWMLRKAGLTDTGAGIL